MLQQEQQRLKVTLQFCRCRGSLGDSHEAAAATAAVATVSAEDAAFEGNAYLEASAAAESQAADGASAAAESRAADGASAAAESQAADEASAAAESQAVDEASAAAESQAVDEASAAAESQAVDEAAAAEREALGAAAIEGKTAEACATAAAIEALEACAPAEGGVFSGFEKAAAESAESAADEAPKIVQEGAAGEALTAAAAAGITSELQTQPALLRLLHADDPTVLPNAVSGAQAALAAVAAEEGVLDAVEDACSLEAQAL
ncbi:hypothetical protein cyc_09199 [Cyclospora cayetanensis]|uniref:Uncharacterized protein n=1 Tax=Cyclospora cayetanensis TaxID=88456 RepID=A0A1D3D178_9EIME|nr:hypothetical protein cyc_09199 [Cyclospora cayetanensis]